MYFSEGNKSFIIASNNGTSFDVNLGKLQSLIAFKTNKASFSSGYYLLKAPAAVIIDFKIIKNFYIFVSIKNIKNNIISAI